MADAPLPKADLIRRALPASPPEAQAAPPPAQAEPWMAAIPTGFAAWDEKKG